MSDIENITENAQSVWESLKKVFSLLKERKWLAAFKECFSFFKLIYRNYLKGKYITVKGKKIPRTLVAVVALLLVYIALPSTETKQPTGEQSIAEAANAKKEADIFDKEGLKVYDLRKCETEEIIGACGKIENYGDYDFGKVTVIFTFHTPDGNVVYEGGVEATDVKSHTRIKMSAPCSEEFSYFKLKDVVLEDKKAAK